MTILDNIAVKIIKEQELIIGPVAWQQAQKVNGLRIIDKNTGEVSIDSSTDAKSVVDSLVAQYVKLFGRASKEVSKEAVSALIADLSPSEVPQSLQ
jgi:type IV secretory pathway component VirB8